MILNIPELETRVKSKAVKKFLNPEHPELVGWCYTDKCQYDKLWDEHTMVARGVVTTTGGTVISRPFPKFFNLGEKEAEPIDWKEPIEVSEKLDGSLIVVAFYKNTPLVNSKGSFTSEHAQFARKWLKENSPEFWNLKESPCTFLFEAIFPSTSENEVKVVNYGNRADLSLLAVINTKTGEEYTYDQIKDCAKHFSFPYAPHYDFDDINTIISRVKARESAQDGEGLVLHFMNTNKRVKIKSDVYIRLHRLISHANRKTILQMLINGDNIEEIYSTLPDEFYNEVKKWVAEYLEEHKRITDLVNLRLPELTKIDSRKEQSQIIYNDPELNTVRGIVFTALDGRDVNGPVWDYIKKNSK